MFGQLANRLAISRSLVLKLCSLNELRSVPKLTQSEWDVGAGRSAGDMDSLKASFQELYQGKLMEDNQPTIMVTNSNFKRSKRSLNVIKSIFSTLVQVFQVADMLTKAKRAEVSLWCLESGGPVKRFCAQHVASTPRNSSEGCHCIRVYRKYHR